MRDPITTTNSSSGRLCPVRAMPFFLDLRQAVTLLAPAFAQPAEEAHKKL